MAWPLRLSFAGGQPLSISALTTLRDIIQQDPGQRGLARIPGDNLLTACAGDFAAACRSIADHPQPRVAVVTGFFIPAAEPPAGETDGPPGALFVARALTPLGIHVALASDPFCLQALVAGLRACGLENTVRLVEIPSASTCMGEAEYCLKLHEQLGAPTHLISLERVGPTHTPQTLRTSGATPQQMREYMTSVAPEYRGRCHSMRARDITTLMRPAHLPFENRIAGMTTIGIGDGGNEIGMGKIAWDVIRRNIPRGDLVACRTATDLLVVCGVSNWGGYALSAGIRLLRNAPRDPSLFDARREHELLQTMVTAGPLVDGVTSQSVATVDNLSMEVHGEILRRLGEIGQS